MIPIEIGSDIRVKCPELQLGCLLATVHPASSDPVLKGEIAALIQKTTDKLLLENIHDIPAVRATREAYRACGKEPSRYRPSAEALLRRVVTGKGLYEINNVVDLLNSISVRTGYSIGGFDVDRIQGAITLGIGQAGEPYEAIARGELNIEFLPVLRDDLGAFGTPTSDCTRTCVTEHTRHFLMVFYEFAGSEKLEALLKDTGDQYQRQCRATSITHWIVK